jgi:hypothetical protein
MDGGTLLGCSFFWLSFPDAIDHRSNFLRTAYRIISRCSLLWSQAPCMQIVDLSTTHHDPLARTVSKRLHATLSRSARSMPPTPLNPFRLYLSPHSHHLWYRSRHENDNSNSARMLHLSGLLYQGSVNELVPPQDFVLGPLPATYVLCELASRLLVRMLHVPSSSSYALIHRERS